MFCAARTVYSTDGDHLVLNVVAPIVARCRAEGWIDGHLFIG
jgi:hypothetical protein